MKLEPVAWPLVESPGEFTNRLKAAYAEFGDLLSAVRHVMIENPPTIAIPPGYKLVPVKGAQTAYVCVGCEAIYWDDNVSCDCQVPSLDKFRKVEVIEGEQ